MFEKYEAREFMISHKFLYVLMEVLPRNERMLPGDKRKAHECHPLSRDIRSELFINRVREIAKMF